MKKTDSATRVAVTVCDNWSEEDDFLIARTPHESDTKTSTGNNKEGACETMRKSQRSSTMLTASRIQMRTFSSQGV